MHPHSLPMSDDRRCGYVSTDGSRCRGWARTGKTFCFGHDPSSSQERRTAGSKGGRGRQKKVSAPLEVMPTKTPQDVASLLSSTIAEVRAGKMDQRVAYTVGFLTNQLLRAMEVGEIHKKLSEVHTVLSNRGNVEE